MLDNLVIYEREIHEGASAPASSQFTWNQVFFDSFQAGYLKRLDWDLYCRLESPVAKRLYRFLDKRFYRGNRVEIDLGDLAERKVRLSSTNDVAQHKRSLLKGMAELEREWELKPLAAGERFRRESRGKWTVVLERRRRPAGVATGNTLTGLAAELAKAGVSVLMARKLGKVDATTVRTMLALFEYYRKTDSPRQPGFLVKTIREPDSIRFPPAFRPPRSDSASETRTNSRIRPERKLYERVPANPSPDNDASSRAFEAFWSKMPADERKTFEMEAVRQADHLVADGYRRTKADGGPACEHYRRMLLLAQFERTEGGLQNVKPS